MPDSQKECYHVYSSPCHYHNVLDHVNEKKVSDDYTVTGGGHKQL